MANLGFKCSCCGNQIEVTPEQIGYVVYCTNCMAELIVPDLTQQVQVAPSPTQDFIRPQIPPEKLSPFSEPTPSQIIYRDAEGNPLISDDVSQAAVGHGQQKLSDTKMELANTLRELQEQQRALAEARKELAEKRKLLAETNQAFMSETTNSLVDQHRTERLPAGGHEQLLQSQPEPLIQPPPFTEEETVSNMDLAATTTNPSTAFEDADTAQIPIDSEPAPFEEADTQQTMLADTPAPAGIPVSGQHDMRFRPLFTPHGDFLPFSEDDISLALHCEDAGLFEHLQEIYPTANCWSYTLFAIVLEYHIDTHLPETLRFGPMPTVFFGGTEKYLQTVTEHEVILLNILRRMLKPLGEQFQHAVIHHDIHAFAATARELDQPMADLRAFVNRFQQEAFPKKSPFPELRDLILSFYHDIRFRLLRIVDRLHERSELSPVEADKGSVSVSIVPHDIHHLSLLLKTIPKV